MSAAPPDEPTGMSRTKIMLATMVAEVVGTVLIVFVLPFAWGTRLVLVALFLGLAHFASRAVLRRSEGA